MMISSKYRKGFTLIELLITIAIVGILAAIALPAYDRYVRKTNRTSAKTIVEKVRGLQETYYTNQKAYTDDLKNLGFTASPAYIDKTGEEIASTDGGVKYEISVNTATAGTMTYCATCDYEIVAVPKNNQTQDKDCAVMWLNSRGQKGAKDSNGAATTSCW